MSSFTLALNCYKVERFVDEAIDGAFNQTYRSLEIVISDDHSPDCTWEKILAKVASYGYQVPDSSLAGSFRVFKDRPPEQFIAPVWSPSSNVKPQTSNSELTLVLNRAPQNLGLARHENRLFEIASGDYIAFQAGDDISVPERMERIADAVHANPQIRCLHSHVTLIDGDGKPFQVSEEFRVQRQGKGSELPAILGAGAVYHRDVYWKFGPLGPFVRNEDHVLPLRARLLGEIRFLDVPLVIYRKHGANESGCFSADAVMRAKSRLKIIDTYLQVLVDLHRAETAEFGDRTWVMRYRKKVKDDLFLQWFLGNWRLGGLSRRRLLLSLVLSPSCMILFAKRFLGRYV